MLDDLGSRKEVEHIHTILERGTSADEQLQIYRETNDLKAVVDKADRAEEKKDAASAQDDTERKEIA